MASRSATRSWRETLRQRSAERAGDAEFMLTKAVANSQAGFQKHYRGKSLLLRPGIDPESGRCGDIDSSRSEAPREAGSINRRQAYPIIQHFAQADESVSRTTHQIAVAPAPKMANKMAAEGDIQGSPVSWRSSLLPVRKKSDASDTSGPVLWKRVDIPKLR